MRYVGVYVWCGAMCCDVVWCNATWWFCYVMRCTGVWCNA